MATFVNSSSGDVHVSSGGGSGTTLSVTLPAGVSTSSTTTVFLSISTGASTSGHTAGSWTGPTGWAKIGSNKEQANGASTVDVVVFAAPSNVTNLTFTINGTNFVDDVGWICVALDGVDLATPIDVAGTPSSSTSSGTVTAAALTIATANACELIGVGQWLGGAFTASGYTVKANAGVNQSAALLYNLTGKPIGSTGTVSVACSGSTTGQILIAMPFAVRPASTTADVTSSDSTTLSDSAAGACDFPRTATDAATVADVAGGGVDRTSTASDSTTLAASASAGLDLTLAGSDTLTVSAAAAGGLTANPTIADAATMADAGVGNVDRVSILADTATLSDAAGGGFDITIAASAALTLADAGSAGVDAAATAGTGVTLGDSGGAAMDASGSFSDAITVADTAASQGDFLSSLADALTLSDAAFGDVTSGVGDLISIRERIERVVRSRVATIYGVGRAFRWDMRGVIDPATGLAVGSDGQALLQRVGDALVLGLDENKLSGQGTAVTALELALQVQVKMGQDADETVTTSELLNRWLLRIERAVMANPEMWEGGTDGAGVRLAVDTIVSHTRQGTSNGSVRGGGEAIAAVDFVIEYQHFRNDPYAGPSITRVSVPAIDEFAAAGTPDPEDDTLSIKERIEQLIQATVAAVDGVGRVFRWDMRGLRDPDTGLGVDADGLEMIAHGGDALVLSMDESAEEGAQGSTGMTIKMLAVRMEAKSSQDADLQQTTEAAHTSWLAKFESALLANPRLLDAQGAMLAIDVRVTQTHEPPREAGQIEAISAIDFEIEYEHYRNDPAAGPGVTHLVEA